MVSVCSVVNAFGNQIVNHSTQYQQQKIPATAEVVKV